VNRLDQLTWQQVAQPSTTGTGRGTALLIPLGSTEQHGPHLPLTTDTDIAVAVADAAAMRDDRLVVAPALAYGSSGEHQAFPGTISIGSDATQLVLVELVRSAILSFDAVVIVTTHGGNSDPVAGALTLLAGEGHPVAAWSPTWQGDLHAGRTETSLMLAIAPDRVRLERAAPGDDRSLSVLLPILRAQGVRSVSGNGVLGDPSGASADEGRELLWSAADQLVVAAGLLAEQFAGRSEEGTTMEVQR
jgi:creatinine amidohydrolase